MEINCQFSGVPCLNFSCTHNVYADDLKIKRKVQTEKAASISNCMLKNGETTWTLEEIGEAWGLTREAIRLTQEKCFEKIRSWGMGKFYE